MSVHSAGYSLDYEAQKALADAKEAILGTTQGGSAADVYATLTKTGQSLFLCYLWSYQLYFAKICAA